MSKNINVVLEGKYKNNKLLGTNILKLYDVEGMTCPLSKDMISSYSVIDVINEDQYSYLQGAMGIILLGGFGAFGGINGRKEYLVDVEWKEGDKSLISFDEEFYKIFVKSMF